MCVHVRICACMHVSEKKTSNLFIFLVFRFLVKKPGREMNIHAMRLGPGKHLQGRSLMGGIVSPEDFDYFHELIISFEYGRLGLRGSMDGLLAGGVIGLPPVLNYGSPALQAKVVPEILDGKKLICLAVSEAFAGSDVGGLETTAMRTEDGGWIVNGTKKWITNGMFADYFTTACRVVDSEGKEGGYVVLLIERGEGVDTRPVKTSYSATAGTAFVTFDDVKVPKEHTIGKVGEGMKVILSNFNHERWMIVCVSARTQRFIVEECFKSAFLGSLTGDVCNTNFFLITLDGQTNGLCLVSR